MSISELIAPQLPYLRRFARVLSGSQASGDAYVVAMLEAIAAEPKMLSRRDLEPRVATYRTFLKVWNSVRLNHQTVDAATSERLAAADRKLEAITPRARQAFLLMAVEEFSTADTALVLETDEAGVKALVDQAASEIAEQVATNVLIIEDEPMIAIDLADLVTGLGHDVCETARTAKEAVAIFRKHRPGLVLADIQLADGSSGLDAVNEILEVLRRAGDLHHRLSRAPADRQPAGADLPRQQALPHGDGAGRDQPGAVLRLQGAAAPKLAHGVTVAPQMRPASPYLGSPPLHVCRLAQDASESLRTRMSRASAGAAARAPCRRSRWCRPSGGGAASSSAEPWRAHG